MSPVRNVTYVSGRSPWAVSANYVRQSGRRPARRLVCAMDFFHFDQRRIFVAEGGTKTKGVSPLADKPAPKELLIDVAKLEHDYYEKRPDTSGPTQLVIFGTSGYRGSPFHSTFTEAHSLAITLAICEYRHAQGTDGPPASNGFCIASSRFLVK
jgi:hypothetical protein